MQEIQAVFVDCDGVLYDVNLLTYDEIVSAARKAGSNLGLDWDNFDRVHEDLKSQGFHGFYNTVLQLCQTQGVSFEKLAQNMTEILDYSRILPNPQLLSLLQQAAKKIKLFIFTNNTRPHLEKVFARLFGCTINQSGLSVITAESTFQNGHFYPKRMEGVFTKWCHKLKLNPTTTLMLDDSINVIDAARKEKLQFIKIENAYMTEQILKEFV